MIRLFFSGRQRRLATGHLLLVLLVMNGCAALGREALRERQLRRAVMEDRAFTVEEPPAEAPAHRSASFRLAAEGYRELGTGRLEEAEDKLEKALSLDPRNPFCYLYLAEIRFSQEDIRQALVLLSQAEVLFQGHPYWLGEVYTRKGQYWEALEAWDKAKEAYSKALEYNPWNEESRQKVE